jgi:hypothetical protein
MAVPVPDFGSLSSQQKTESDYATNQTNIANRPNQFGPMGSTTWGYDPATGKWTQNTGLTGGANTLFNNTLDWQNQLGSKIAGGAPEASFGAVQQVIDAWNRLQQPGLAQQEASARSRASALGGVGAGTPQSAIMEGTINDMKRKAGDTSITHGWDAFNQLYQNQLAGFNANRGAATDMTGIRNSLNPNEWTAKTPESAAYMPKNVYGAGLDTFSANLSNENARIADRNSWMTGAANLGTAAGGIPGIASGVSDIYKNIAKPAWNFASNYFNGGGGTSYDDLVSNLNNSGMGWAIGGSLGD